MRAFHLGVNTLFHVPGDVGGTETYLREILRALIAEYPELSLTLFTHNDNDHVMRDWIGDRPNITYCLLPVVARIRPLRILAEQMLLPLYVKKSGVDVLWSPGYTAPYFSYCPQVVTIHDLQYKQYPQDMKWLERITLDRLVKIACSRCQGVITVSEFSRQEVLRYNFASADSVYSVLEGVNPLFSVPVNDSKIVGEMRALVPDNAPFILCVAHTYPHKNVHLLVEAFNKLSDLIPHNLILVGNSRRGEPEVAAAIQSLKKTGRLYRLYGGISFDLLRCLYQHADVFVLPSGYEGFGLPVLEAMMAGTPVVCAEKASLPEVGGSHAFYAQPLTRDTLVKQVLNVLDLPDDEKKRRLQMARNWAEGFSWGQSAAMTVAVCNRLSNKPS